MANSKVTPNGALGPSEYPQARKRADQSTIASTTGSYYSSPERGNRVDPRRINPTRDGVGRRSSIYPAGESVGGSF